MSFLYFLWEVDPRVFPPLEWLRWYGLFWAVGMLLSYRLLSYVFRKEGKSQQQLDSLTLYLILGIVVGARLGHVLFYDPAYYWEHPIEILPIKLEPAFQFTGLQGLASHGGTLGALLALLLFCRKYTENFLWLMDRLVLGGALLGGFIRLGNLMNSEIIGIPTEVPWAFVFTHVDGLPRHPGQLYEALFYLLLFVLLFSLWKKSHVRYQPGFMIGLGLAAIFSHRFLIEYLKEDQVSFEGYLPLNMGQLLSIPFILVGLLLVIRANRQQRQNRVAGDQPDAFVNT